MQHMMSIPPCISTVMSSLALIGQSDWRDQAGHSLSCFCYYDRCECTKQYRQSKRFTKMALPYKRKLKMAEGELDIEFSEFIE